MAEKEKIRPIYSELQGYLSQAPATSAKWPYIDDSNMWGQVNSTIDELNGIANASYDQFKLALRDGSDVLLTATYRAKLGGLISRLHGEYFFDEAAPFSGMPSTVITQTQQQSQSQTQMLIDFTSKIDEEIYKLEPGDKKRTFLEKVKGALGSVRDYAGLIALYLTTAKELGITLEELSQLFR